MIYTRGNAMQQQLYDAATNFKIAASVALGTAGTGVSTWFNWIPDDIGKLASLIGLALAFILILVNVHAAYLRHKKYKREE